MAYKTKYFKYWRHRKESTNTKSRNFAGHYYDSILEANVGEDLFFQKQDGIIKDYWPHEQIVIRVNGEFICNYLIDFKVEHNDGSIEYIEVKGVRTQLFTFKWRVLNACHEDIIGDAKLTELR